MSGYYTRLAVAWLASIGCACTSAPVRYYTLSPSPDESLRAAQAALPIDVRVVHVPPQVNRSELTVRTGPAEVTILENERWTSPMRDEIKEAMRFELRRRLGGLNGLRPFTLEIDVQRLEAELGRYALLEASWRATSSGAPEPPVGARVTTCAFRAQEAIGAGYAAMVEGYQREIAALADAVATVLTGSASDVDAACQSSTGGAGGIHH